MGFRFDGQIVGYFIVIPFLAASITGFYSYLDIAKTIRKILQVLFIVLATLICIVTINYYKEYNNQFNHFMFLALYDDQKAVLNTILDDFHPIINLICFISMVAFSYFILSYFENKSIISKLLLKVKKPVFKTLLIIGIVFLLVSSLRGSFSSLPIRRYYASITQDAFLNKTIINPFRSLTYAISDFQEKNATSGENPFISPNELNPSHRETITSQLKKESQGALIEKPKQIFIVVMESLDSWPLMDNYASLNLTPNLKFIQDKGIRFENFLPAANTTMNSFAAITSGVPYSGVNISEIGAINPPFKTSLYNQFKALGYHTNFFYGGYLSWQNIGNFNKNQGAEHVYGGPNTNTPCGVWGTNDVNLFNFVTKTVPSDTYSINVILTTSYHPPYEVAIEKEGFPYKTLDAFKKTAGHTFENTMNLKELGHLWYSDKAIGNFVKTAEQNYPNAVFVFTGDHFGRRFINSKPNLYEKSSVPLIIYGSGIQPSKNYTPGSHIDILPTLLELVAPKGFDYYSFGNSLLEKDKDKLGIGYETVISKTHLYHFSESGSIQEFDLNTHTNKIIKKCPYSKAYTTLLGRAWQLAVKGDTLQNPIP
ncbi:MAG: LTA synthase family protein [Gelidibacter sp.]|nr:LTA synthase family protein [Gelidibacter sp.]